MTHKISLLAALIAAVVLSGCGGLDVTPRPLSATESQALEREIQPNFDLTTVLVVRLGIDDAVVEATSLFPSTLPTTLDPRTGTARTWIYFDAEKTVLRVFTRGQDGTGHLAEVPVVQLPNGGTFTAPLAQSDGTLKPTPVTIRDFLQKP